MIVKAKKIGAVQITLSDGTDAVFVQDGAEWNTLIAYRCIAPAAFAGDVMITAQDPESPATLSAMLEVFGRIPERLIVMASPRLASAIKAISSPNAEGAVGAGCHA